MTEFRSWKDVRAAREALDRAKGRDVDLAWVDARRKVDAYIVGYRLAELRRSASLAQIEVAARMGVSQARVSQVETGDAGQLEVDTIRRYVDAVGGRLRLVADFDDHDVIISTGHVDRSEACV